MEHQASDFSPAPVHYAFALGRHLEEMGRNSKNLLNPGQVESDEERNDFAFLHAPENGYLDGPGVFQRTTRQATLLMEP